MANINANLTASVQPKKGRLYAVIQYVDSGKRKSVWRSLGLPEGSPKTKIQKALRTVVNDFEDAMAESSKTNACPITELPIFDFMCGYLERVQSDLQINTYRGYRVMVYGRIKRYFGAHSDITVGNITANDIRAFYDYLTKSELTGATIIHFHSLLHRAFSQAFKDEIIDANPFDRVDRPKKTKYRGEYYSEEELVKLLDLARDDTIYPAIVLAGGLGLRRSEALGVRWSRIDFEKKTVLLDTKIVEYIKDGKRVVEPISEMKNESSRRTLPLPAPVYDMLIEQREKQALYQAAFKRSYDTSYSDFVCVNQLGELIHPSYVTNHFSVFLNQNGLRKIRFHDLRHTFASILLGKEVPLINVSNFLGHSDISTTANIYAHLDRASKQISADVITDIFKTANK